MKGSADSTEPAKVLLSAHMELTREPQGILPSQPAGAARSVAAGELHQTVRRFAALDARMFSTTWLTISSAMAWPAMCGVTTTRG